MHPCRLFPGHFVVHIVTGVPSHFRPRRSGFTLSSIGVVGTSPAVCCVSTQLLSLILQCLEGRGIICSVCVGMVARLTGPPMRVSQFIHMKFWSQSQAVSNGTGHNFFEKQNRCGSCVHNGFNVIKTKCFSISLTNLLSHASLHISLTRGNWRCRRPVEPQPPL